MPTDNEYGCGCLSVKIPINGCSNDAVTWKVKVRKPIWPNVRP
jgi:hypothetical protein